MMDLPHINRFYAGMLCVSILVFTSTKFLLAWNYLDCDNLIEAPGAPATDDGCNMACSGNSAEKCGGTARISVFSRCVGTCS